MQTSGRGNNYHEILTGWKEIARYLGMGVRTVQRYERELGLPTRRISGHRGGSVLATKSDLDYWADSRPIVPSSDTQRTAQIRSGSAREKGLRERSRLQSERMTLRRELKEDIREVRKNILKLRQELRRMRERQNEIAEAVAWYSRIIHRPTAVAKR